MIVITVLNIIVVFMSYLARFEKHRYLLAWAFILLISVLGIRYGYGNDFFNYEYFFNHGSYYKESEDPDPGWLLLNKLFKPFGFSSFVFFLTAIEHLMLYDLIRRYVSPNYYWLALFIYLFNPYFMLIGLSMMRQFLVQVLGFYAMELIYKRKWLQFLLIVIFSVSIHKVGLLLIPLAIIPFMSKRTYSRKMLLSFVGIGLFLIFFITIKMDDIINVLIELFEESDMKYGDSYLDDLSEEYRINPKMILRYVLYILLLVRTIKYLPDSNSSKNFAVEVTFGVLFIPFGELVPMAIRASWIYSMVIIIALPLLLRKERNTAIRYVVLVLFCLLLVRDYEGHFISDIYGKYYMHFHTIFSEYATYDIRLY